MKTLPVLISIPHGGTYIPEELKGSIQLSPLDLIDDSDAFTREIYDIKERATSVIKADILRAIVDLNRSIDQRPPDFPDGIIKSHTCYGKQIYHKGKEPDSNQINDLIQSFYQPFHESLKNAQVQLTDVIELALDCHSMAAIGPEISKDQGKNRPLMCLGNLWGQSCSDDAMNHLADCFCQSFGFKSTDIQTNQPFAGGYITQTYGKQTIPWIQVEMSRALYMTSPYFDRQTLQIDSHRLTVLNQNFQAGLALYFNEKES
ncbi:MAG: N-formylglutamate amidohydrolase [Candidatus Magnetomorum sp.]|nr:N-formylglutamate amidohydrolase [Candidatus Magnetomorum sp.]